MRPTSEPDRFQYERELSVRGIERVAGVDEAGRGPLAGPVVAAAVVLPTDWVRTELPSVLNGLNDSKQLSSKRREAFFAALTEHPEIRYAVAEVNAAEIDRLNILQATHRAMIQAVGGLKPPPEHVLVDGREVRALALPHTALVKGDARSYSIAAASIVAKVTRDRLMRRYDYEHPEYGFARHKGYGTKEHLAAIARLGPCPIHRRTFAPMKPRRTAAEPAKAGTPNAAAPSPR